MFDKHRVISNFLSSKIEEGLFPSAVYLIYKEKKVTFADSLGYAVIEPKKIPARFDTIYDLASLTKPLITSLLYALLIEKEKIRIDDKISSYFPEFNTAEKSSITILDLLTHTSGFRPWMPFYLLANSKEEMIKIIAEEKLAFPTSTKVVYSDLNFIVLSFLLEKIYQKTLKEIAEKQIISKLELEKTFFNPPKKLIEQIAASERGNLYEKQMCIEQGYVITQQKERFFRNYVIWGEVHDGNCWFMGGISGHAGLFSNVFETMKIAQQFLAEETLILKPTTCQIFQQNFTKKLNDHRSIGFQLATTKDSLAYQILSKRSFGHLGFTGTGLWIDPEKRQIFILFTNRTHLKTLPFANINPVRKDFLRFSTQV